MSKQVKIILQGYLYAGLSAAVALWMNGVTDWKTLGTAAIGAVVGPLVQALNPKDCSLGVGSDKSDK